ncbi:MAG TPA: MBL fold metallo-hydrolase [Ruminococcaceae bacterium]|jgi:metallo-beta-lactamase class B|nr:MBL fold metallo-hydrolase [Oscillospiraceae bacterium]
MKEKDFLRLKALNEKLLNFMEHPWLVKQRPFHIVGDVYFVGNRYVSSFLIDGGDDGLTLIDCAFQETAYLLFDSIRALGFDPNRIRRLFISHGHVDHCGAARLLQEYSRCEIFLGEPDNFFFTERPDLILFEQHVPRFTIDHFYEYNRPITFGRTSITPVLTPGHTPGTTTFFIRTPHEGRTVTCAMHGGIGINGLSRDELKENRLPLSLQQDFLNSLKNLKKQKVDVILASHSHQYNMLQRAEKDDGSGNAFLDGGTGWTDLLDRHIQLIEELIRE